MNTHVYYQIALDRQADLIRQVREDHQLERQLRTNMWRILRQPFALLEGLMRYRRAVFNTVLSKNKMKSTNLRVGTSN